jgi:molybdate transport system substrate-binding protein
MPDNAPPSTPQLTVLCSLGLAGVLGERKAAFERAIGMLIAVVFGPTAGLSRDIENGQPFDVAVLTAPAIDGHIRAGVMVADARADLARSRVGATVTPGAPKPDIGSVEGFRAALLAAGRVCYTERGASGVHFASLLPGLGIEAEVRAKALIVHGLVAESVVRGDADFGIQQVSEILAVPGAVLVGPIPDALQAVTTFSAGVSAKARQPAAASAFIRALAAPDTIALAVSKGLERV